MVVRNEQVFIVEIIDSVGCTVLSLVSYSGEDEEPVYQIYSYTLLLVTVAPCRVMSIILGYSCCYSIVGGNLNLDPNISR